MMNSRLRSRASRLSAHVAVIAALSVAATPAVAQRDGKPPAKLSPKPANQVLTEAPRITYTRFVLKNGLVVLLHEDHSAPVVSVDVWYHVGSKDDTPGKTGLAHMYEHMMFETSPNVPEGDFKRIIQQAGGTPNASTSEDRTSYIATGVPSNMLETVLWLEADRMAFGASRLDTVRFNREREVVASEYHQRYDGAPANNGLAREAVVGGLFGGTGYGVTQFGKKGELATTTLQDLRDFFERYTTPNNATLSIAGDFKSSSVRTMVERYFADIPRRAAVTHPRIQTAPLTREQRFVLEDRIANNSHLWLAWRGAPTTSHDRVALEALSAILSGGPASRLQQALVNQLHLANSLPPGANAHYDLEDAGVFQIGVFARPAVPMTAIEVAIDSVLSDIRANGVQAIELQRWLSAYAVRSVVQLESDSARARLLAEGETFHHKPTALLDDLDAARQVTPADVQRVARKYLGAGRVVLSIVPAGKLDLVSKPNEPYVNVTQRKAP